MSAPGVIMNHLRVRCSFCANVHTQRPLNDMPLERIVRVRLVGNWNWYGEGRGSVSGMYSSLPMDLHISILLSKSLSLPV